MSITITYDLTDASTNQRSYLRSTLERFHWRRLGGSVFRYDGIDDGHGGRNEDWLNHVVPALMFFRSFIAQNGMTLRVFTVDAHGVAMIDHSDVSARYGHGIQDGPALNLTTPTNNQSAEQSLRDFVHSCITQAPQRA